MKMIKMVGSPQKIMWMKTMTIIEWPFHGFLKAPCLKGKESKSGSKGVGNVKSLMPNKLRDSNFLRILSVTRNKWPADLGFPDQMWW